MAHYVYVLQSLKDFGYYIGESADVPERVAFHNAGRQRSTHNRIPFRLILTEKFPDRSAALLREKQIKSWKGGTAFKKLINGM
jgi:putative endonuclease